MLNQEIIDFASHLADLSEEVIKKYFRKNFGEESKADESPVTLADKETEEVIRKAIMSKFPQHGIIGEEFGIINSSADYQWIIDPIDGTTSFVIGRPIFGTLISLTYKNSPLLGIINQPITSERWLGISGQQTTLNNKPIKSRDCSLLQNAVLCTTSPAFFKGDDLQIFNKISSHTKYQKQDGVIYGGDCYLYGLLAAGFVDVIIEQGLSSYDFMALITVIEGSGGIITDWEGNKLGLNSAGKILACGDKELHKEILKIIS